MILAKVVSVAVVQNMSYIRLQTPFYKIMLSSMTTGDTDNIFLRILGLRGTDTAPDIFLNYFKETQGLYQVVKIYNERGRRISPKQISVGDIFELKIRRSKTSQYFIKEKIMLDSGRIKYIVSPKTNQYQFLSQLVKMRNEEESSEDVKEAMKAFETAMENILSSPFMISQTISSISIDPFDLIVIYDEEFDIEDNVNIELRKVKYVDKNKSEEKREESIPPIKHIKEKFDKGLHL